MSENTPVGGELHKVRIVSQPHLGEIEVHPSELRDLLLQGLVAKPTKAQQAAAQASGPQPTAPDSTAAADTATTKKES